MYKGYLSDAYGQVFNAYRGYSGAQYIKRPIDGTEYFDIINTYPLAVMSSLYEEAYGPIRALEFHYSSEISNAISLLVITDPLQKSNYIFEDTWCDGHSFKFDVVREYKDHYFVDLTKPLKLPDNHKRNIRKALAGADFNIRKPLETKYELSDNISLVANDFYDLYSNLIERHSIIGMANFTKEQITQMLRVPGTLVIEARSKGAGYLLGMMLIYLEDNGVCRYHLACYSDLGYEEQTGFGLLYYSIEYLKSLGYETYSLGAGSGVVTNSNGLTRYKQGFSNCPTRKNYLLFKVLQSEIYSKLCEGKEGPILPLYRN